MYIYIYTYTYIYIYVLEIWARQRRAMKFSGKRWFKWMYIFENLILERDGNLGVVGVLRISNWCFGCFYVIHYNILYIWTYSKPCFETFSENLFFRNDGDAKPVCFICALLLRFWDLSHGVEHQKLMVTSQEETAVRPKSGLRIEGASWQ